MREHIGETANMDGSRSIRASITVDEEGRVRRVAEISTEHPTRIELVALCGRMYVALQEIHAMVDGVHTFDTDAPEIINRVNSISANALLDYVTTMP